MQLEIALKSCNQREIDELKFLIHEYGRIILDLRREFSDEDSILNCDNCPARIYDECPAFNDDIKDGEVMEKFNTVEFCNWYLTNTLIGIKKGTLKKFYTKKQKHSEV